MELMSIWVRMNWKGNKGACSLDSCILVHSSPTLKDALKGTFFSEVDEILLRIYYLYEKCGKKCRQLDHVVQALKQYTCNLLKCLPPEATDHYVLAGQGLLLTR